MHGRGAVLAAGQGHHFNHVLQRLGNRRSAHVPVGSFGDPVKRRSAFFREFGLGKACRVLWCYVDRCLISLMLIHVIFAVSVATLTWFGFSSWCRGGHEDF